MNGTTPDDPEHTVRVGVASDGKFGDRAFGMIRNVFPTTWILVPYPSVAVLDEVDLTLPDCDLIISYARHPDVILAIAGLGEPLILGINPGPGLVRQAARINPRTIAPVTMCSLLPETGIPEVDRFAAVFGCPLFEVDLHGDRIQDVRILREAPCGSTRSVVPELVGRTLSEATIRSFGLRVCHHCAAPRLGRTCDKEYAGFHHCIALLDAIGKANPDLASSLRSFREKAENWRNDRIRACGCHEGPRV